MLVAIALVLELAFLVNMILWREAPDRGWIAMSDLGPHVVAAVRPLGERAGLRKGDRILSVNGQGFGTNDELRALLDLEIGHSNRYQVERGGERLSIEVATERLGMAQVVLQSGIYWALGMIFLALGVLVFMMKPYGGPSWAFLLLTGILALMITYAAGVTTYRPARLVNVVLIVNPFLGAALFHLTAMFPQRRRYLAEPPWWILGAYAFSGVLAGISRYHASDPMALPTWVSSAKYLYMLGGVVLFLGSTLWSYLRTRNVAVRLQSLVIATGTLVALFVPLVELLANLLLGVSFFPNPILFYVLFLVFFPLSIGYAIVRHDLFEIDVIVRRTYGYLLSTATIVAIYLSVISGLNLTVGPSQLASSPFFSVSFVLGVVFLMQPLHRRFQGIVDRLFYRQQYDYRKTITAVSERMTTILDPDLVYETLLGSVVREMFLENGLLLLPEVAATAGKLEVRRVEGIEWPAERSRQLELDSALLDSLRERRGGLFRHEVELAPSYAATRALLGRSFDQLEAELMLPILYHDELKGILSLGRKKSGKMFTLEDLDLLRTMMNQSVIALENARLFDDLADSLKRIQMLESIKSNLAKFVPQTVQDLIEESPDALDLFDKRETDLSVVFADMTGYTRLSSQLPLDEVNRIVERYFGAFLDEIIKQGGDVNETAGDGLMVLFRDKDPRCHAEAAVRAALGIQRRTREINVERGGEIEIGMHVGVNSGVASVGATKIQAAGGMRWTYTASGPITNLAARLAGLGHEIVVTEETRRRLHDGFEVQDLGPQSLKNVTEPMRAYLVTAERAALPDRRAG